MSGGDYLVPRNSGFAGTRATRGALDPVPLPKKWFQVVPISSSLTHLSLSERKNNLTNDATVNFSLVSFFVAMEQRLDCRILFPGNVERTTRIFFLLLTSGFVLFQAHADAREVRAATGVQERRRRHQLASLPRLRIGRLPLHVERVLDRGAPLAPGRTPATAAARRRQWRGGKQAT